MKRTLVFSLLMIVLSGCSDSLAGKYFDRDDAVKSPAVSQVAQKSEVQQTIDSLAETQKDFLEKHQDSVVYSYKGSYNYDLSGKWTELLNDLRAGALDMPSELYQRYSSSYINVGSIEATDVYRNYFDKSALWSENEYIVGSRLDVADFEIYSYYIYEAEAILNDNAIHRKARDTIYQLISSDANFEVLHNDHWHYRGGKLLARDYHNRGRYIVNTETTLYIITNIMGNRMQIDVYSD